MTKEEIQKRIQAIGALKGDDEAAHSREDDLRNDFIKYLFYREDEIGELAKLVLSTNRIKFARYAA